MPEDSFVAGLRVVFERRGDLKPARVATDAGLDNSAIRKMFKGEIGSPRVETAERIAAVLGMTVAEIIAEGPSASRPTIAIAGKVGAGARVPLVDAYEKGDGPQVELPPQLGSPHGIVAVEVEGDSMEPVYSAGDLLFYSRDVLGVPDAAVGRRCVCEDEGGDVWVKQVKAGRDPGTFDLHSINAQVGPMWGVRLKWAAPVKLHLPVELAVKKG